MVKHNNSTPKPPSKSKMDRYGPLSKPIAKAPLPTKQERRDARKEIARNKDPNTK
jgi:ribosomal RNA-processing protein 8